MEILEFCTQYLQSQEVEKFELYFEKSTSLSLEIHDGKLDLLSRATAQGVSIRTLKYQQMGFSYTCDLSKKSIEQAVRTALEVAELMPADPLNDLCNIGSTGNGFSSVLYPNIENYDAKGLEAALDQKIEIAKSIELVAK